MKFLNKNELVLIKREYIKETENFETVFKHAIETYLNNSIKYNRLNKENDIKSSYFLSLLFSFYGIFNILLLLLGKRNKYWGVGLFLIFLGLQRIVLIDHKNQITHERNEY